MYVRGSLSGCGLNKPARLKTDGVSLARFQGSLLRSISYDSVKQLHMSRLEHAASVLYN